MARVFFATNPDASCYVLGRSSVFVCIPNRRRDLEMRTAITLACHCYCWRNAQDNFMKIVYNFIFMPCLAVCFLLDAQDIKEILK